MKARLDHRLAVLPTVQTFWFAPERPLRYLAGQYVELGLPHAHPDDRGDHRWFSLSSAPTEPLLGITVKFAGSGSTFKHALLALQPGGEVTIGDPLGDFVLPRDSTLPVVFIAAGIGITPVRSMMQWLTDTGEQRNVQVIYITRTPAEAAFLPLLAAYPGVRLHQLHAPARNSSELAADILQRLDTTGHLIYLSGPQPLIEGLWLQLQQQGVPRDQLVLDYFPGYDAL